jgi:hypothetical protein
MRDPIPQTGGAFVADCEKSQAPYPGTIEDLEREAKRKSYEDSCTNSCSRLMSSEEILHELFSYHPPTPTTLPKFQAINQAAKNFAEIILQNCPAGNDRAQAIGAIRMARMVANAAIALNGLSFNY